MKKRTLVLIWILALVFTGAGAQAGDAADMIGTWNMVRVELQGETHYPADIGIEATFDIDEAGSAEIRITDMNGNVVVEAGTWVYAEGRLTITCEESLNVLTMVGDELYTESFGYPAYLTRATAKEQPVKEQPAAESFVSGQWKYELVDGGAVVTGYLAAPAGDLTIPRELDGHPVTGIGHTAFEDCKGLTGVTVPDSVTHIGDLAFAWNDDLISVTLSEGVTSIDRVAFGFCKNLTSVTLPASVTSIGFAAFSDSGNVTVTVQAGSYAEQYAVENGIPYVFATK